MTEGAESRQLANNFGRYLLDSISVSEHVLDELFAALFATAVFVFIGANLLLFDLTVLHRSALIAWPCMGLISVFYAAARIIRSPVWGLVSVYALMCIVTYSRQQWLAAVVYIIMALSFVYVARHLRLGRQQLITVLLMAALAALTIVGCKHMYTSFDMLHRLHAGNVHLDTLFHASIAAMVKNYGVVSTGLHGLVETPYHAFSHILIASVSVLSGLGVIEVYGVAPWLLFAPLLIFSVVVFCMILDNESGQLNQSLVWCVVCVLLVVAPAVFHRWAVTDSYFVSESYLVSLGLFVVGSSLLYKNKLSVLDLLLICILSVMIASSKASVGLFFAGLWFARMLFVRDTSKTYDFMALVFSALAVYFTVITSVESSSNVISLYPLDFVINYSLYGSELAVLVEAVLKNHSLPLTVFFSALVSIVSFFLFHFVVSWVIIAQLIYEEGVCQLRKVPAAVYTLSAFSGGAAIIALFSIPGGSAYYFSNIAFFVTLPSVAVLAVKALEKWRMPSMLKIVACLLIVLALNVKGMKKHSFLSSARADQHQSAVVDMLMGIRSDTSTDVAFRADASMLVANPVKRCMAQPFVFPAVSERPWVGVITPRSDCFYQFYGYSQYGITDSRQQVTMLPVLISGMKMESGVLR
jgi:hypothetical protein